MSLRNELFRASLARIPAVISTCVCLAALCATSLSGQESGQSWRKFEYSMPAMGVELKMVVYALNVEHAQLGIEQAVACITRQNQIFSDYLAESEVGSLAGLDGDQAGHVEAVVSQEFHQLLVEAQEFSSKTDGAFDVTLGALTGLWRGIRKDKRLPKTEVINSALQVSGFQRLEIDHGTQQIRFPLGLKFDFGGIAKGATADKILDLVSDAGCPAALVSLGGDIAIGDPPPGKAGWRVQVQSISKSEGDTEPRTSSRSFIEVSKCGVATSGDAYQFVEIEGVRYSHILNPRTGLGIERRASVTVVAKTATAADALASAFSVMSIEQTRVAIENFDGASVLIQQLDDEKKMESRLGPFPEIKSRD